MGRKFSYKPRKSPGKCENCGVKKPDSELFIRVDGNNGAITRNAPFLCKKCYVERYGIKHIK